MGIVGALAVATALRFYHLASLPNGLNQDEAVNGYDAYSVELTRRPPSCGRFSHGTCDATELDRPDEPLRLGARVIANGACHSTLRNRGKQHLLPSPMQQLVIYRSCIGALAMEAPAGDEGGEDHQRHNCSP